MFLFKKGSVNVQGLLDYLNLNNLPKIVSLSEDATAIVGKREYNSTSNSKYGFSLPLQSNGLPNWKDSVIDNTLDAVRMFSTYKRATVIIVIMAQPLGDGIPPMRMNAPLVVTTHLRQST